jgi:hypothetical protein
MLVLMADQLDTALTHVSTLYGLYISQRQNVVNYYLAAVALLSVAYVAALDKGRTPIVVAVCLLGMVASAGAFLHDKQLRIPMRLAENALRDLQEKLAEPPLDLSSLTIQSKIDSPKENIHPEIKNTKPLWQSRGGMIRAVYGLVGALFLTGAFYAFLA